MFKFNFKKEGIDIVSEVFIRLSAWVLWAEILMFVFLTAIDMSVSWETIIWTIAVTVVAFPGALLTHKYSNLLIEKIAKIDFGKVDIGEMVEKAKDFVEDTKEAVEEISEDVEEIIETVNPKTSPVFGSLKAISYDNDKNGEA